MTANISGLPSLAEFESFLEVHGPNRSRWPAQKRLAFSSLLANSADARRLLAEAEALERLIESASGEDEGAGKGSEPKALVDRIVAAALASEPRMEVAPKVTKAEAPEPPRTAAAAKVIPLRPVQKKRVSWPVGAMMAASLLLGLTTGLTAMTTLGTGLEVAANESAADAALDPAVIALDNDTYGPLGGDLL